MEHRHKALVKCWRNSSCTLWRYWMSPVNIEVRWLVKSLLLPCFSELDLPPLEKKPIRSERQEGNLIFFQNLLFMKELRWGIESWS